MAKIVWRGQKFKSKIEREVYVRLNTVGAFMRGEIVKKLRQGSSRSQGPSSPGTPPHRDSGRLSQSIRYVVKRDRKSPSVQIGTDVIYGRILELGGRVTATTAKALAVPVSRQAKRHKGGPRNFPKDLVLISRGGRAPLLIERRSRQTVIHYVLPKSVYIAARPYLRPAMNENKRKITKVFGRGKKVTFR